MSLCNERREKDIWRFLVPSSNPLKKKKPTGWRNQKSIRFLYISLSLSLSLSQGVEWKVKNLSHKAKREETEMCERSHVAAGNVCVSGCDTRDPEKKKKKETREPTQKKKEPVDKSIISESNHIYSRLYTADTMCTAHWWWWYSFMPFACWTN